jgi:hypothetical protein
MDGFIGRWGRNMPVACKTRTRRGPGLAPGRSHVHAECDLWHEGVAFVAIRWAWDMLVISDLENRESQFARRAIIM